MYKRTNPNTTPAIRRYYSYAVSNGLELPKYHNHMNPTPLSTPRSTSIYNTKAMKRPYTRKNATPATPATATTTTTTRANGNMLLSTLLNPSCSKCAITSSPFWWDAKGLVGDDASDRSANAKLCQKCYCQLVSSLTTNPPPQQQQQQQQSAST
jgi:hypothetical protein